MAGKEERVRTQAKKNFTTSINSYNLLHADAASVDLLTKAYEKVQRCWELLESAQNAFIEVTDIDDIETDPKGLPYLDVSEQNYQDVLRTFSAYKKKAVTEERAYLSELEKAKTKEEDERKAIVAEAEREAAALKEKDEREVEFLSEKVEFELVMDKCENQNP